MKYYHNYNFSFKTKNTSYIPQASLLSLLKNDFLRLNRSLNLTNLIILETGAGNGSIFFNLKDWGKQIDCLDISPLAIEQANEQANEQKINNKITFINQDAIKFIKKDIYDIVVDSHLFHCLTNNQDRLNYLNNIYTALKPGGKFIFESMIHHSRMIFSENYLFDTNDFILYKKSFNKEHYDRKFINYNYYIPTRKILRAHIIEEEILNTGFKIDFLMVPVGLKIIPENNRNEILKTDPDIMRIIASRPENTHTIH